MKPIHLIAPGIAALVLLMPAGPSRAEDEGLDAVVSRMSAEVERIRGRSYQRPVDVRYVNPFQMMGGGGMPGMGAGPGSQAGSPQDMMLMMGRTLVASAALGVVPEDAAAKWIGPGGRLTMPDFATLFGGVPPGMPSMGGPPGMPPMGGPPSASGGEGGMPGMPPGFGKGAPEGIMGAFYRDDVGQVNVMKTGGEPDADLLARILAHELTHALDDQSHDISRFTPGGKYEGDRLLAIQSVVEGSAVFSELDFVTRQESGGKLAGVLEDADLPRYGGYLNDDGTPAPRKRKGLVQMGGPGGGQGPGMGFPGLKEQPKLFGKRSVFPYAYGFEFVKHLRANGTPVDLAFESLPQSSEQIIHPEKYLSETRDVPTVVKIRGLASLLDAHDVNVLDERVLGEFMTRCVFEESTIDGGTEAAAGWDGDIVVATSHEGRIGLLWASVWDTEADAAQFETTVRSLLEKRFPEGRVVLRAGTKVLAAGGLGDEAHEELEKQDVEAAIETRAWEDETDTTQKDER